MIAKTSNGVEIYYETYGSREGMPVVLIHGLGADHSMWDLQIQKYPSMNLFLIVPDMRGHGRSSRVDSFRIKDCAGDLAEIFESMNLKKVSIVGVSMGGLVAQRFAIDFPDRVEKLVIVDSFSSIRGWMMRLNCRLALFLTKLFSKVVLIRLINSAYRGEEMQNIREYFRKQILAQDTKQIMKVREEVNRFDVHDELRNVRMPTLVLVGDHHGKMAIKMAEETAKQIKNVRFGILKGGGDPS
ncbi:MAG: alpha/beta hydrolase, partial [Euryarchaeota archaeon]|nr:alpha/beta hydrolase [Euryarchaeota archaeon]